MSFTRGTPQRIVGYQVYDFQEKRYFAGYLNGGRVNWSPFKRDACRFATRREAEDLVPAVLPDGREHRVLELLAKHRRG